MSKKLNSIMLVDDNPDDNFYHERVIRKAGCADSIIAKESGTEALEYLKSEKTYPDAQPDLILLDINMPGMNGWDFLEEYEKMGKELQKSIIVIMLTTSTNPDDIERAKKYNISGFKSKPLTKEMLEEIIQENF